MIPKSRKDAKLVGAKTYFTGNPCPNGHISERYTTKGSCVECLRISVSTQSRVNYFKERYDNNKSKLRERARELYRSSPERRAKNKKCSDDWTKRNKAKSLSIKKSYKHRRRAKEKLGCSTSEMHDFIMKSEKVCFWCACFCDDDFHLDHFVPLSKGGAHDIRNFVISCSRCNLRKSSYHPSEFADMIGFDKGSRDFKKKAWDNIKEYCMA